MIDSHCHLDLADFATDIAAVLQRAQQAGVEKFLNVGIDEQHWPQQLALQKRYACIELAFGHHPCLLPEKKQLTRLRQWCLQHREQMVAVGEIGLDRHISTDLATQQWWLHGQLELAQELHLPVILHHRQSHDLLQAALKSYPLPRGGVVHAFSGSVQVAEQYLKHGFYLGVGATITYPRAKKTIETIKQIDLTHLLLETDSPDMPLCGRQGLRNEPQHVVQIADKLAMLKNLDVSHVALITNANYQRLFHAGAGLN